MDLATYAALDGTALAAMVRRGEVTPSDLAATALRAIEVANPTIGAVVEAYAEAARPAAASGDGHFCGVPFLIKDVGQHFAGRRVEYGSRLCAGMIVAADSFFGRLVKASGLNPVGRSSTPEFSMALCAENRLHGSTTNPWRRGTSTGGSSGGAAAAVAAGLVPVAHGSDMGGSIRGPAAWCGTVGLYPSRGRVSAGPMMGEGGHGMTQNFVLTRTVRDTAAALDALGVPQPGDPFVIRRPERPFADYVTRPARPLRIAFSAAPLMDAPVDREVAAAVGRVARVLEDMGHHVEEAAPAIDLGRIDAACREIWYFGFHRTLDAYATRTGRRVGPDTVERATLRFYTYARAQPVERFLAALDDLNMVRRSVGPFFQAHDAWLTPTCAQVAQPFGVYGMDIDLSPEAFLVHEQRPCQFMIANNVSGQPGLSLPLAQHSGGLPIGVQLTARHGEEEVLIQLGAALEQAMPWRDRVPPLHVARLG